MMKLKILEIVLVGSVLLGFHVDEIDSIIKWNRNASVDHKSIAIKHEYLEFGFAQKTDGYEQKYRSLKNYTLDQKCELGLELGIGYQVYTPYLDTGTTSDYSTTIISGIFPHALNEMLGFCCPKSKVTYAKYMASIAEIESHFSSELEIDLAFPLHGQDGKETTQFKDYPFIPLVTAPRIVLLVPDQLFQDLNTRTQVLMTTIFNAWPMLIFIIVSACLAGLTVWTLDRKKNADEFPPTFFAGAWEGTWWAFVTMTTVGYGDRSPKSLFARAFCIMWILLGIVLISLFTGLVSAALNASSTPVFNIPGSKIGAVRGSVEYQVGVGMNAEMISYENHAKMLTDLMTSKVLHAAMIDNFILSASTDALKQSRLRMEREIEHPVTYGMVMVNNSSKLEQCFHKYKRHYPQELFEIISDKLVPVKNPTDEIRVEVQAAEKLFYEEAVFKKLVYTECGLLVIALLGGVLWEILVRNKNSGAYRFISQFRKSGPTYVDSYDLEEDKSKLTNSEANNTRSVVASTELQALLNEYDEYHTKWIDRVKSIYKSSVQ